MMENLSKGFVELNGEAVLNDVRIRLEKGEDPLKILDDARQGMVVVGEQYQIGEFYLAEMMLAAEIFKQAVAILQPSLDSCRPPEPLGKVVLATAKGDVHDLGKNILGTLLQGQGFEVHDLGVDVEPSYLIERVKEVKPDFLGLSALITTVFARMEEISDLLEKENLRKDLKLMVGGGITTPVLMEHLNADFQTTDAMEGVAYCVKIMKEARKNA
jgi:methylmalonyl-CoA mutase cobalamin-binding domain/chain